MSVEGVRIVRRDPGDADLAVLLDKALAELKSRYGPGVKSPVLADAEYYVALLAEETCGCGVLQRVDPGLVEIKRMYVPARFRGRGIARAILKSLEDRARATGSARVRLQTGTRQPEAISLYASAAYKPCEPWGRYAVDPNALCFSKTLS
ncbi:MAG TPA: GNAT family N-acetyltransferase [Nocardioidaceae bacterium]